MNYTFIKQQIENNTQKLSKTLEKFNLPGYVLPVCYHCMLLASYIDYSTTKAMLEDVSATVSEFKKKPTTSFKESVCHFPVYIVIYT